MDVRHGPLAGVRIVELDAAGPVPFACMLLADLGCDIVRIRRAGPDGSAIAPILYRGRSEVALDLTNVADRERALALIAQADGVVSGEKALFEGSAKGKENAVAAFLRGAIGIDGDRVLLVLFQRVFPAPPRRTK